MNQLVNDSSRRHRDRDCGLHRTRSWMVAGAATSLAAGAAFFVPGLTGAATSSPSAGPATPSAFSRAAGTVAAVLGSAMEVQNPQTGQVTVSWTPSTAFSEVVDVAATAVAPGDCVTVSGSTSKGRIQARSVSIAKANGGRCTAFGALPPRAPAGPASGTFSLPSGARRFPPGAFRSPGGPSSSRGVASLRGAFASGTVLSVSQTSMVLRGVSSASLQRRARTASTAARSKSRAKGKGTRPSLPSSAKVTVALGPSTTYSEVQPASPGALAVGDCVSAAGTADSTGAITAATIRITSSGGRSCSIVAFFRQGPASG
ncbi:MAG TPA: DUF5666 domain-containing protein [Acidimicrobiales bacterium]|nr:DUF5666 domain-containing protein [Acidimicrobiales bacterium]